MIFGQLWLVLVDLNFFDMDIGILLWDGLGLVPPRPIPGSLDWPAAARATWMHMHIMYCICNNGI